MSNGLGIKLGLGTKILIIITTTEKLKFWTEIEIATTKCISFSSSTKWSTQDSGVETRRVFGDKNSSNNKQVSPTKIMCYIFHGNL